MELSLLPGSKTCSSVIHAAVVVTEHKMVLCFV